MHQSRDGRLLANLMHFARTLRAAGLPVGPGKVIDAVAAVQAVGITDRSDFYWTLHAVFVNRPDQRLIFDQAFHVFWRNPDLLKKMMGLVLPQMRIEGAEDQGAAMVRRLAEALHPDTGKEARSRGDRDRDRRGDDLLRPRAAARHGFREDVARRAGARQGGDRPAAPAGAGRPDPALCARPARRPRRSARDIARRIALGRADRAEAAQPAPPPAAARRPVRHLRLDEPLQPHLSAFHALGHQRPRPRPHLRVRHAADQHHPLSAPSRCRSGARTGRRGGRRLVGRHPHRPLRSPSSTGCGRAACWARGRSCC